MKSFIVLAVAFALISCVPLERFVTGLVDPWCSLGDTRCTENVVQACGSDLRWIDVQRCDEGAGAGRSSCAPFHGVHVCLPMAGGGGEGTSAR
jgi:hypothetical protein